jgi:pimeloyl-ACP methyl ester carboxylesterase
MNNSNEKMIGSLPLAGTNLYYEVRGSGPVLLFIPAGGGDASSYEGVAEYLSAWYTVVTYDRRGYSHSKLTDPDETPTIQTSADDIHELLTTVTDEPAFVFGSSSGGVIALDLVTRYADQIKAIVIHEPAKFIIPKPDEPFVDLGKLFKEGGPAAVQKYIGVDFTARKSAVGGDGAQREANMKFFMQKEPKMVGEYQYNLDGLKAVAKKTKIIIGGSTTAKQAIGYRGAEIAAGFFGTSIISFPGDHAGYIAYPQEFANALHKVFQI